MLWSVRELKQTSSTVLSSHSCSYLALEGGATSNRPLCTSLRYGLASMSLRREIKKENAAASRRFSLERASASTSSACPCQSSSRKFPLSMILLKSESTLVGGSHSWVELAALTVKLDFPSGSCTISLSTKFELS